MKHIFLVSLLFFFYSFLAKADSTIYIFVKGMISSDVEFAIDGDKVCNLKGSVKKTYKAQPSIGIEEPYYMNNNCFRKILIKEDGDQDVLLTLTLFYTHIMTKDVVNFKCEYPLTIEDGETYYIEMAYKGVNDIKMTEISEKKAEKLINKSEELSEITYLLK